jgi:hypothetical protein
MDMRSQNVFLVQQKAPLDSEAFLFGVLVWRCFCLRTWPIGPVVVLGAMPPIVERGH